MKLIKNNKILDKMNKENETSTKNETSYKPPRLRAWAKHK